MKTMRNLFLLCAGLSLFACSSDDDATQQFPEGNGEVTVKILNPSARSIIDAASAGGVVTGDIKLKLTHGSGVKEVTLSYDNSTYTASDGGTVTIVDEDELSYTFTSIGAPSLLEASMYGGIADYSNVPIDATTDNAETTEIVEPNMQAVSSEIPVYGSTTDFGSPVKEGEIYKYTASVTMTIPVARMEINVSVGDMSQFGSVELLGVYMDKIYATGGATGNATDYKLPGDLGETANGSDAILYDTYLGDNNIYDDDKSIKLTGNDAATVLPKTNGYYAYNFYPNGDNPEFKLLFKVVQKDGEATIPTYQYAILNSYKIGDVAVTFEKQKIYKINVTLNDDNIQIDESGTAITYSLVATITQASWEVKTVTGGWAQN